MSVQPRPEMRTADGARECMGFEQLTGLSAAKGLQHIPPRATCAWLTIEGQPVRITFLSSLTPNSTTIGQKLGVGEHHVFETDLSQIQLIETAASATVDVTYWR